MKKPRLLVTGGTGFLGRHVVPLLKRNFEVVVLSRSQGHLIGDLTAWDAGIEDVSDLKGTLDGMLHMAGLYDLEADRQACYLHNVLGTSQALRLCQRLEIPVFINTSSVAAAVNVTKDKVSAYDLNLDRAFPDAYSESKALAERMIRFWADEPRLRVNLRPGVLVGDTTHGEIERVDGPYYASHAFARIRPVLEAMASNVVLPGKESTRLPLVPVDACARAIFSMVVRALRSDEHGYKSYHLVPTEGLAIKDFYGSVLRHLLIRYRGISLVQQIPDAVVKQLSKWVIGFPEAQMNYLLSFPRYDTHEAQEILGEAWCPEFTSYEKQFWSGYEKFVSNR